MTHRASHFLAIVVLFVSMAVAAPDEPVAPEPPVTPSNYKAALDSLEAED